MGMGGPSCNGSCDGYRYGGEAVAGLDHGQGGYGYGADSGTQIRAGRTKCRGYASHQPADKSAGI
jgi:hypothetical protein